MSKDGFAELSKRLKKMEQGAKEMQGEHSYTFEELFPDSFMLKHTQSESIQSFLADLGVPDKMTFKELPQEDLEAKVKAETSFDSWDSMMSTAVGDIVNRHMGID